MSSSQRTWWWQFIRNSRFCTMNSKQKEERWLEAANYWFPLLKLFIATCCWVLLHIFKLTPHKLQCCYVMYRIIYRSWQLYRDKYHIMWKHVLLQACIWYWIGWVYSGHTALISCGSPSETQCIQYAQKVPTHVHVAQLLNLNEWTILSNVKKVLCHPT